MSIGITVPDAEHARTLFDLGRAIEDDQHHLRYFVDVSAIQESRKVLNCTITGGFSTANEWSREEWNSFLKTYHLSALIISAYSRAELALARAARNLGVPVFLCQEENKTRPGAEGLCAFSKEALHAILTSPELV